MRRRMKRNIGYIPTVLEFKPAGVRRRELEAVVVSEDEFEALRLKHEEGLEQLEAAKKMGVSRVTFLRDLHRAERKITNALVYGKLITLKGGDIMPRRDGTGNAGVGPGRGLGQRMAGVGQRAGGSAECECPKCGETMSHGRGIPCSKTECPKCGTLMRGVFCK